MPNCNGNLTALQRRSVSLVGSSLAICVSITLALRSVQPNHFATTTYLLIASIGALPIVMMMIAIARYLIRETDEYVRNLVIQSILWGFGLVMVADTILGYLIAYQSIHLRSFGVF